MFKLVIEMGTAKNVDEILKDLREDVTSAFETSRGMSAEKRRELLIDNIQSFYTAHIQAHLPKEYSVELNCEETDDPSIIKIQRTIRAPEYLTCTFEL